MAHNKLYRNFIILQEDEKNHTASGEKSLSGYAKIEAKSEKCKISFYAQNLKKDGKYNIVLICYKKDIKQIVDLGSLEISEAGKGETSKEYYINNIAGLDFSYDKISGAAIGKYVDGQLTFLMYGFMNSEVVKDGWKASKIVKCTEKDEIPVKKEEKQYIKEEPKKLKKEEKSCDDDDDHKDKHHKDKDDDYKEDKHHKDKDDDCKEDKHKKKDKDKDECDDHKEKHKSDDDECEDDHHEHKKEHKSDDSDKDDDHDKKEHKKDYLEDDYEVKSDCEKCDNRENESKFDKYENIIEQTRNDRIVDPNNFEIRGSIGDFFNQIVKDFEEVKNKIKDIKYCKWYKVKVNSLDDMCNSSNYNKYTIAYYPMLNYYPYIKKYGYFMLGYKCDSKGDLKYIVYGVPGKKDKDEQPYAGKTGFVTWSSTDNDMGCWLMFYDYKTSTIVVPMK